MVKRTLDIAQGVYAYAVDQGDLVLQEKVDYSRSDLIYPGCHHRADVPEHPRPGESEHCRPGCLRSGGCRPDRPAKHDRCVHRHGGLAPRCTDGAQGCDRRDQCLGEGQHEDLEQPDGQADAGVRGKQP